MVVRAERDEDDEDFETAQIELELDEAGYSVVIYDNGKWSGSLALLDNSDDICSILPFNQFCCHFKS